jgi:hypothetical protein
MATPFNKLQFSPALTGKWLKEDGTLHPNVSTFLSQLMIQINELTNYQTTLHNQIQTLQAQVNSL